MSRTRRQSRLIETLEPEEGFPIFHCYAWYCWPWIWGNLSDYLGCSVLGSVSPSLVKISTCSMLVRWGQIVSASFYSPHCNTSFECSEAVAPQSCLRIGCGFLSVSRDHRSCCSILFWFLFWGHSQQHSGLSLGSALRNTFVSAQGTVFI